ncbi:Uncharacterized protein dnm_076380 [Desulfonema magnum]|uniref:Uncharacterized protein n=1 Tax=Desulfonema magnum TaxID=45655 RepID=A0A975BTY5_9BACT|nr:Uncharacterized protein dnm_076380 [Desulfonema magnum]
MPGDTLNAVDLGNSERIRSAKILFLRLRKSIFRTPEKTPENPLTLKSTVLGDTLGSDWQMRTTPEGQVNLVRDNTSIFQILIPKKCFNTFL